MFLILLVAVTAYADDTSATQTYDARPTLTYVPPDPPVHDAPIVIETECGTWVVDTINAVETFVSLSVGAGGKIDPAHEANMMRQLRENWPGEKRQAIQHMYTRAGWKVGQGGNRICMWKKNGDVLCFEPRGNLFVEVYVGSSCPVPASYTREEALVILSNGLDLDPNWHPPRRKLESTPTNPLPEVWPGP